jgi:penicillin amidase
MELLRRTGQGRLSEIFGERTFNTDVFLRTLDLAGHAERSLSALSPDARKTLEAYARGVKRLHQSPDRMVGAAPAAELLILRHTPEPWGPADSMVATKMMALQLRPTSTRRCRA